MEPIPAQLVPAPLVELQGRPGSISFAILSSLINLVDIANEIKLLLASGEAKVEVVGAVKVINPLGIPLEVIGI